MSNRLVSWCAWLGFVLALVAGAGRARAEDDRAQLLAIDPGGGRRELPLVQAAMQVEVRGPIAQVRLTQRFANPSERPIEAIYVFPLHQDGAVGAMTMRIGARTITAEIRKRDEARKLYDQAKQTGTTAALLEQERPNVFTQSVTGILPGEAIDVALVYDILLEPAGDTYELALPTVVGPRFIPDTTHVPDAARISPPVARPGESTGNAFSLELDLDAGLPIAEIDCPTHVVVVSEIAPERFRIALADPQAVANKDFVLRWRIAAAEPTAAVLAHKDGDLGYAAVILQPPALAARADGPRELVFVVDTSGSMEGEPIAIAKQAMRFALRHMRPDDRFRILNFSTEVAGFDGGISLVATPAQVQRALSFVNGMRTGGGTQMLTGIRAALANPPADGRPRYILFLTDGYIGNEDEILAALRAERPKSTHLFSFGVGSSVNRYLLEEMARQGQGAAQILLLDDPPQPQIERFYRQLDAPMWSELQVEWEGVDVIDTTPQVLPALFAGGPIVVAARYRRGGAGRLRVRAMAGGNAVSIERAIELPERGGDGAVLGRLWARRRIRELTERLFAGSDAEVEKAITAIALAHALASRFTSFVAIDRRPRVDGTVDTVTVPVELPEGVTESALSYDQGAYSGSYGGSYGETIVIDDKPPAIDPTSTQQSITLSSEHSIDANYYLPNATGHFPGPRGHSGRARGELGAAGITALDGSGYAGELHLGVGLRVDDALELGAEARLSLRAHDRRVLSMLLSLARWSILRDLGLRLGAGGSGDGTDLGAAWRAELAWKPGVPILTFGIGATTAGEDHTDVGLGLGVRF